MQHTGGSGIALQYTHCRLTHISRIFVLFYKIYFGKRRLCSLLNRADAALGTGWSLRAPSKMGEEEALGFAKHLTEPEALALILQVRMNT